MALATLCKALSSGEHTKLKYECTAFIVDHKIREGSTEEAKEVAEMLRKRC